MEKRPFVLLVPLNIPWDSIPFLGSFLLMAFSFYGTLGVFYSLNTIFGF
jgi:hypothetical protein